MWRRNVLLGVGVFISVLSFSQVKKQFLIEQNDKFETLDMKFTSKSGRCYIKPSQHPVPLSIYSNQDFDDYEHSFNKSIRDNICFVDLSLTDKASDNLSKSISSQMFTSGEKKAHKMWKMYLSQGTTYKLDLNYGMGESFIDLSGLSIEQLKVTSSNANVNIGFMSALGNQVAMDTFYVKVEMGSVNVKRMALSNANIVMADIGFGNLFLDYSDITTEGGDVRASVGAGNLVVLIPKNDVPVRVRIEDTMLCKVKLSPSFNEVEKNVFVTSSYTEDNENTLAFDVDVSLGSIIFKEADE